MRMDRLTNRLMQALQDAQSLALSLDHNEMSPWHLLKALLTQSGGIQCQFIGSGLAILFMGMQHSQSIRNVIFQSCDLGNNGVSEGGGDVSQQSQQQSSSYNIEIIASAIPLMHLTSLSLVDVHFPTEECLHYLLKNVEYAKELKLLGNRGAPSIIFLAVSHKTQMLISSHTITMAEAAAMV